MKAQSGHRGQVRCTKCKHWMPFTEVAVYEDKYYCHSCFMAKLVSMIKESEVRYSNENST